MTLGSADLTVRATLTEPRPKGAVRALSTSKSSPPHDPHRPQNPRRQRLDALHILILKPVAVFADQPTIIRQRLRGECVDGQVGHHDTQRILARVERSEEGR